MCLESEVEAKSGSWWNVGEKMAGILTSLELYAHLCAPGNEDRKDSSGSWEMLSAIASTWLADRWLLSGSLGKIHLKIKNRITTLKKKLSCIMNGENQLCTHLCEYDEGYDTWLHLIKMKPIMHLEVMSSFACVHFLLSLFNLSMQVSILHTFYRWAS